MTLPEQPDTNKKNLRTWLILGAVLLLVGLTALVKSLAADRNSTRAVAPDVQLEAYKSSGTPVMVFFHSPDCLSCLEVQKNIETAYPDYKQTVSLIDVDVTVPNSHDLVQRLDLRTTPTLLFMDRAGREELYVGVISISELTGKLDSLSGAIP